MNFFFLQATIDNANKDNSTNYQPKITDSATKNSYQETKEIKQINNNETKQANNTNELKPKVNEIKQVESKENIINKNPINMQEAIKNIEKPVEKLIDKKELANKIYNSFREEFLNPQKRIEKTKKIKTECKNALIQLKFDVLKRNLEHICKNSYKIIENLQLSYKAEYKKIRLDPEIEFFIMVEKTTKDNNKNTNEKILNKNFDKEIDDLLIEIASIMKDALNSIDKSQLKPSEKLFVDFQETIINENLRKVLFLNPINLVFEQKLEELNGDIDDAIELLINNNEELKNNIIEILLNEQEISITNIESINFCPIGSFGFMFVYVE